MTSPLIWLPSPHHYRGRKGHTVDVLVMHYTAGVGDARATARVFSMRSRQASAHFIEGRDGDEVQCVDCDDAAWHAGDGRIPLTPQLETAIAIGTYFVPLVKVPPAPKVLNCRSIGIEVCNRGWAKRGPNPYAEARHRNPASRETRWESYSNEQIDRAIARVKWLKERFPTLKWICGHEDATHHDTLGEVGGKLDPGPLFPWAVFTALGLKRVAYDFQRHGWKIENGAVA